MLKKHRKKLFISSKVQKLKFLVGMFFFLLYNSFHRLACPSVLLKILKKKKEKHFDWKRRVIRNKR